MMFKKRYPQVSLNITGNRCILSLPYGANSKTDGSTAMILLRPFPYQYDGHRFSYRT